MSAPKVRGNYEQLQQIAAKFKAEGNRASDVQRAIKGDVEKLRGGDWIGKGATRFYQEMDSDVLPALKRLIDAMGEADRVTLQIKQVIQQAEADAAKILDKEPGDEGKSKLQETSEYAGENAATAHLASAKSVSDIIDDVIRWIKSWFAPADPGATPDKIGPPVTPEQAQQIFNDMKDEPDIAFDYPPDGCYARAHIMAKRTAERYGTTAGKGWIFAEKSNRGTLDPNVDYAGREVKWVYHVAPVIQVRQPDGSVVEMIIDPSIASGPVTMEEWKRIMQDRKAHTQVTQPGRAPINPYSTPPVPFPGSGYWPGPDPSNGFDDAARETMTDYKERAKRGSM
jgi:WXG100 family type VII secretion target